MILLDPKYTKLIVGALDLIREELDRLYWNKYHKEMNSPFDNSGETYSNDTFTVKAYDWVNNNDDYPNFNYKNILHVYWYKYAGRGVTAYIDEAYDFNIDFLADMVNDCIIEAMQDFGEENDT